MFRSTSYSLLLLPAFLLHTANASTRWDSISTVQYPKYYVVHNGNEAVGDPVNLAQKPDVYNPPPGSNLFVFQNVTMDFIWDMGTISNPNGNLFIGANSDYTTLIWVSEPLPMPWLGMPTSSGIR
ncbi:hypothetical protein JOM56_014825 [Amanita muscaria]